MNLDKLVGKSINQECSECACNLLKNEIGEIWCPNCNFGVKPFNLGDDASELKQLENIDYVD